MTSAIISADHPALKNNYETLICPGNSPNCEGDEEYIVRLIGRVITGSAETQKIVYALPALWEK